MRKNLTDRIKESGENDRMKGFAYSQYTTMIYKIAGIDYKKTQNFRETLPPEQLERIKNIEDLAKGMLEAGLSYQDIKDNLGNIFPQIA